MKKLLLLLLILTIALTSCTEINSPPTNIESNSNIVQTTNKIEDTYVNKELENAIQIIDKDLSKDIPYFNKLMLQTGLHYLRRPFVDVTSENDGMIKMTFSTCEKDYYSSKEELEVYVSFKRKDGQDINSPNLKGAIEIYDFETKELINYRQRDTTDVSDGYFNVQSGNSVAYYTGDIVQENKSYYLVAYYDTFDFFRKEDYSWDELVSNPSVAIFEFNPINCPDESFVVEPIFKNFKDCKYSELPEDQCQYRIATASKDANRCAEVKSSKYKDECYSFYASENMDKSICEYMKDSDKKAGCIRVIDYKIEHNME